MRKSPQNKFNVTKQDQLKKMLSVLRDYIEIKNTSTLRIAIGNELPFSLSRYDNDIQLSDFAELQMPYPVSVFNEVYKRNDVV